jgi:hypothetical protein
MLPLKSPSTSADITIRPRHWAIGVNIPYKDDPALADRSIFVRAFIVNQGNEAISLSCAHWRDDKTKISEHSETLLPSRRLLFFEGTLSHCGTTFDEIPRRSGPHNLHIEIEPISRLDKDYLLTIYARWGHGIDL